MLSVWELTLKVYTGSLIMVLQMILNHMYRHLVERVGMGHIQRRYFFSMVFNFDFVNQRCWILSNLQLAEGKNPCFFYDTSENSRVIPNHLCCDVCANDCQCGETECQENTRSMAFLMSKATEITPANAKVRNVTEVEKKKLESLLKECQDEMRQEFQESNLHCLYSSIDKLTKFL